jgi:hypothetical protein
MFSCLIIILYESVTTLIKNSVKSSAILKITAEKSKDFFSFSVVLCNSQSKLYLKCIFIFRACRCQVTQVQIGLADSPNVRGGFEEPKKNGEFGET